MSILKKLNPFAKSEKSLEARTLENSKQPTNPGRRGFLKSAAYGAAGLALAAYTLPACSSSPTGSNDYSRNETYSKDYETVKRILSNENTLDTFAGALMTGDITGYTKDQVKTEIRNWLDNNPSNEELYYGLEINNLDNVVAFKFGTNANTPSFAMEVSNISEEAMRIISDIFTPYDRSVGNNLAPAKMVWARDFANKMDFHTYYTNIRK